MAEMQESETVELEDGDEPKRSWRRDLEDRAKTAETKASELETQLAGLQRAEAFRSAGIDPTDSRQSYFVKGYDGKSSRKRSERQQSKQGSSVVNLAEIRFLTMWWLSRVRGM